MTPDDYKTFQANQKKPQQASPQQAGSEPDDNQINVKKDPSEF